MPSIMMNRKAVSSLQKHLIAYHGKDNRIITSHKIKFDFLMAHTVDHLVSRNIYPNNIKYHTHEGLESRWYES